MIGTETAATLMTADEFEHYPEQDRYELVDGELEEMPEMGTEANWVSGRICVRLSEHCERNHLGWVFPAENQFACFPGRPNLVRKPDGALIRFGRLEGERLPRGRCRIAPDLVIEVVSPSDVFERVELKLREYLDAGIPLIWVIDPANRVVYVHRPDSVRKLIEGQELTGDDVVPGFSCQVADLFPPIAAK